MMFNRTLLKTFTVVTILFFGKVSANICTLEDKKDFDSKECPFFESEERSLGNENSLHERIKSLEEKNKDLTHHIEIYGRFYEKDRHCPNEFSGDGYIVSSAKKIFVLIPLSVLSLDAIKYYRNNEINHKAFYITYFFLTYLGPQVSEFTKSLYSGYIHSHIYNKKSSHVISDFPRFSEFEDYLRFGDDPKVKEHLMKLEELSERCLNRSAYFIVSPTKYDFSHNKRLYDYCNLEEYESLQRKINAIALKYEGLERVQVECRSSEKTLILKDNSFPDFKVPYKVTALVRYDGDRNIVAVTQEDPRHILTMCLSQLNDVSKNLSDPIREEDVSISAVFEGWVRGLWRHKFKFYEVFENHKGESSLVRICESD